MPEKSSRGQSPLGKNIFLRALLNISVELRSPDRPGHTAPPLSPGPKHQQFRRILLKSPSRREYDKISRDSLTAIFEQHIGYFIDGLSPPRFLARTDTAQFLPFTLYSLPSPSSASRHLFCQPDFFFAPLFVFRIRFPPFFRFVCVHHFDLDKI